MKPKLRHYYALIFIALMSLYTPLKAQDTLKMDAHWTVKTNDGTHLILELGIRTDSIHEHLGPAQFIFLFNDTFVSFAGGDTNTISGTDYNWIDSFRPSLYTGMSSGYPASSNVTQPVPGEIIVTLNFNGAPGASISSTASYTPVIDFNFFILDPTKYTSISWAMGEGSPPMFDAVEDDNYGSFFEGIFSGNTVNPLPVELIHFNAEIINKKTALTWATASEINNHYFTVEKSADAEHFSPVIQVFGAGNSESIKDYYTTDPDPLPGISYYRLKQTDFNNDSQLFYMVAVKNAPGMNSEIQNINISTIGQYPEISYSLNIESDIALRVTDINDKLILSQSLPSHAGMNKIDLNNTPELKPGMYFIGLYSNCGAMYTKMIVP